MKRLVFRGLRKLGLLGKLNIQATIRRNRHVFHVPIKGEVGLDHVLSIEEKWTDPLLKNLVSEEVQGSFVDVGVNIGQTLLKLKSLHPEVKYVGFEPNPVCGHFVDQLITLNNLQDVEIFPVGLSHASGLKKLKIFSDSNTDGTASIVEGFRKEENVVKEVNVPAFNFSDISIDPAFKIRFLKIDVEGGELDVIEGLIDQINKDQPMIAVEILPTYGSKDSMRVKRQERLVELITECGYAIFRIEKLNGQYNQLLPIEVIENEEDLEACDYLIIHMDHVPQVLKKMTHYN